MTEKHDCALLVNRLSTNSLDSILFKASQTFESAGSDTPRLDAEVLLSHVLGWNRAKLLAHLDYYVSEEYHKEFQKLINRRLNKEPVAYIIGKKEFYSWDFVVTNDVLIPRPETELLIDMAVEWLEKHSLVSPLIVDVGTGSGNIAVTLAKLSKDARFFAIDISNKAIDIAQENAKRLGVSDKIQWFCGDLLQPLNIHNKVNVIIANLPYVPTADWKNLSDNVKMEPSLALDGGEDGLDLIRRLLQQAQQLLGEPHAMFLEVGPGQTDAIKDLQEMKFYSIVEVRNDLQGIPRAIHLCLK